MQCGVALHVLYQFTRDMFLLLEKLSRMFQTKQADLASHFNVAKFKKSIKKEEMTIYKNRVLEF